MRRWLAWPPGRGLACPPGRGLATLRTSSHPSPPFARPGHEMAAKCGRGRASVRRHAAESHHVIRACGHDRGSVLTSPWVTAPCEATAGDSRADGTVSDDGHEYGRAEALQEAPRTMRYPELLVQGSPCTLDRSGEQTGHDGGPEAARRCRPTRALTSRGIERTSVTPAASGCVGDDRVHAGPREAVEDEVAEWALDSTTSRARAPASLRGSPRGCVSSARGQSARDKLTPRSSGTARA